MSGKHQSILGIKSLSLDSLGLGLNPDSAIQVHTLTWTNFTVFL